MINEISHRCRLSEHNSFSSIPFYLIILLILVIPSSLLNIISNLCYKRPLIPISMSVCITITIIVTTTATTTNSIVYFTYFNSYHSFTDTTILTSIDTTITITVTIHNCPYRNHHLRRCDNHHHRDNYHYSPFFLHHRHQPCLVTSSCSLLLNFKCFLNNENNESPYILIFSERMYWYNTINPFSRTHVEKCHQISSLPCSCNTQG